MPNDHEHAGCGEVVQEAVRDFMLQHWPSWDHSHADAQKALCDLLTSHCAALTAEVERQKDAIEECAKPYFWQQDGFWADASTPAHKEQEIDRRRRIALRALAGEGAG